MIIKFDLFTNLLHSHRVVESLILRLDWDFPCKNVSLGCVFVGKKSSVLAHLKECQHREVPCPAAGCQRKVQIRHMKIHVRCHHKESFWGEEKEVENGEENNVFFQQWTMSRDQARIFFFVT